MSHSELFDHPDPYSAYNESTPISGSETEFEDKAKHAFLNYCKEEPLLEECVDVDDCNVGLMTEVETDYNPVASDEEVTVSSKPLPLTPLSRKRHRRVSVIVLSDDDEQAARDVSSRRRPRKKKKKERALVLGTHLSGDGHEGDDEFEIPRSLNPKSQEICSLCVIGTESYGDATFTLPFTFPAPFPQTLCPCCQPASLLSTMCPCSTHVAVPVSEAAGYVYVSCSDGLHCPDQVEYNAAVALGGEDGYPYNAVVLNCGELGYACPLPDTSLNLNPDLFHSFAPITVQPCTCVDCTPLP